MSCDKPKQTSFDKNLPFFERDKSGNAKYTSSNSPDIIKFHINKSGSSQNFDIISSLLPKLRMKIQADTLYFLLNKETATLVSK